MSIDKELYRQAFEQYRNWNEAELMHRVRNAGKLTPEGGWRQYTDMWKFCIELSPQQSEAQRKLKLRDLDEYYSMIKKFEKWRRYCAAQSQDSAKTGR
ncbi:MAG: hypothetical protein ACE5IR_08015 [bacterium]